MFRTVAARGVVVFSMIMVVMYFMMAFHPDIGPDMAALYILGFIVFFAVVVGLTLWVTGGDID